METNTLIILIVLVIGFAIVFWLLKNRKPGHESESMLMMQEQIKSMAKTLDEKLSESTKLAQEFMSKQFSTSTRIITDVTEKLTKLDETSKQVLNYQDQLKKLEDILKNPKQRGILGEYYLETLLKSAFNPKQYQMQYQFKNGDAVDAVLFMGDKVIPIDSKFSLENYNRIVEESDPAKREELEKMFKNDLKKRIDETAKYIRPQENTTDFAFMFIPAEGIYYDLLVNQVGAIKVNTRDLIDYAIHERKVHIVSPTTFYVTLQSLWQGMRAYQIQESTKDILKNVGLLGRHLKAYQDYFVKLGSHLGTTVNTYNKAHKELGKIDKDVLRLTGEAVGVETESLERPSTNEDI
jgi:DNA recombination protein RmuC